MHKQTPSYDFDPSSAVPVEETEESDEKSTVEALNERISALEARVHKLASRPMPKDNTPALIEAFTSANKALCDAICSAMGKKNDDGGPMA